jgi:hypothetical protein
MNTASATTAETLHADSNGAYRRHACGHSMAHKKRWAPAEIATMVGGFVVFWPLGLAALGLKLFRGEMWTGASEGVAPWTAYKTWRGQSPDTPHGFAHSTWSSPQASGNAAFDDYKKAQLERLEAERRKLEDEQKAFSEYLAKLRRAKDQDEFDRFMAERNTQQNAQT